MKIKKFLRKHSMGKYRQNLVKNLRCYYNDTAKKFERKVMGRQIKMILDEYNWDFRFRVAVDKFTQGISYGDILKFYFGNEGLSVPENDIHSIYRVNPHRKDDIDRIVKELKDTEGDRMVEYLYNELILNHKYLFNDPFQDGINVPDSLTLRLRGIIFTSVSNKVLFLTRGL